MLTIKEANWGENFLSNDIQFGGDKISIRHEKTRKSQNNPFLAGGLIILHSTVGG